MKIIKTGFIFLLAALIMTSCALTPSDGTDEATTASQVFEGAVEIILDDAGITVDGKNISTDSTDSVYAANDIIYYEEGKDFTYGEGSEEDAHSKAEADAHTVVHIGKPGKYLLSGKLSSGQIAVDLGEGAEENSEAVVTLILGGADITCTVAPAVIFYNVYECGNADEETATKDVDTRSAGANIIIADGTENNISGSYVAKIYKSYELNADGTEVVDSKKLHKYDGAFYSKRTMNIIGGENGDGILNINAENEGLDSELHLTINGGIINITSGNDGINTNEDNVSVTAINGGVLNIFCDGSTGEGDGIDSNGWLVINGGTVTAQACAVSGDAGIDSDMGIFINGGTVVASGNMLDRISGGDGTYAVFNFASRQNGGNTYALKNAEGNVVGEYKIENAFSYLIVADDALVPGDYTLWQGEKQFTASAGGGMTGGFGQGERPERPEGEENISRPFGENPPEEFLTDSGAVPPVGEVPPTGEVPPEGDVPPEMPEGFTGKSEDFQNGGFRDPENAVDGEKSAVFAVKNGGNYYNLVDFAENL